MAQDNDSTHDKRQSTRDTLQKILLTVLGVYLTVSISITGYVVVTLHGLQLQYAAITSSRFTREDGANLLKLISANTQAIAILPKEAPPGWFKSDVDDNTASKKDHERRISRIETILEIADGVAIQKRK